MIDCELCQVQEFPFLITFCKSHPDEILVVSTEHKKEFNKYEKELIRKMFPGEEIRWIMNSIKNHAHCHIKIW